MHLYYAHILGSLLWHGGGPFAGYFRVRHLLPPYALYYYLLIAIGHFTGLQAADRVVICLYLVSFTFGFRYLARAVGPAGEPLTPLATVLLLNWPLGMGFVNFCLSLSFALWALGLWLRSPGYRARRRRAGFLVLVALITLTHPVPLLLLLGVAGAALLVRIVAASRAAWGLRLPVDAPADLVTLAIAALSLVYVKLFTVSHPLAQTPDIQPTSYWTGVAHSFAGYAREHALAFVLGSGSAVAIYRAILLVSLPLALGLAIDQRRRNRRAGRWTAGDTLLVLGLLLAVALPFVPSKLNGLYYFADRLVLCVWLALLLAAAGWQGSTALVHRWGGAVLAGLGVLGGGAALVAANATVRPAAMAIVRLNDVKLAPGQLGLLFEDGRPPRGGARAGVAWNPYYWATLGLFRRNDAVLANAPWMDETILPVADTAALPEERVRALREPVPNRLEADLLQSPADRAAALGAVSFLVVNAFDRPPLQGPEPLLSAAPAAWRCEADAWFRVCRRQRVPGQAR